LSLILHRVMQIVAEQFGEEVSSLTPGTRFVEDLAESLEFTETIMACEEEFALSIPNEDAVRIVTIGLLADYIEKRLGHDSGVWPPAPRVIG